ncbi:major facilitator superfamily domain-containing protein [Suillus fuscotomentosus]|uniref:Major facilitator superfamily domain-containing protein n=1 Tax=Suillus fuscotomentosus TaxID=1912939 RepID=A0AAD4E5J6_9AGAM|nr:major facilitator superfamily domain-containing protein [Suillus fuscotomentosus]XP_041225690.1 major facilitator superfamily domain-containing protein [Suillus fuscotomentosus]KAG1890702.1 major facilitator superfamily domain-containing protein [Suillus fuscotomentosus]KAG1900114.1 major facilitator superfamily domain-containing protein [Suillus fuscotomentosus]
MASDSEESPMLEPTAHESIDDRFVPHQKRWILFHVSFVGLLAMFVQVTFVPSIPQIAKDLNVTDAVVSLAFSLSIFANAIGELIWSTYSSFFFEFNPSLSDGRRPIYLWGMPFLCVGSCGVALSASLQSLLFWRFVQMFGCSGALSLGAGVIGDIYKLEERGTAIGAFVSVTIIGYAVAPFVGGAATQYWSWRNLHYSIGAWGLLEMLFIYLSFPETTHPGTLGIDKLPSRRSMHIAWINPLSSLWLLRSPNLFAVMLVSTIITNTNYILLVPLAYTIGVRYGITNEAIIGAFFLPNGLGSFTGALIAGRLSDTVVRRWREKRGGAWCPEDRLRAAWIGGFIVPLSIGASGLITTYIGGPIGLGLNILCLYANGVGVDLVLNPINTYNVDVMHSRSAEATAACMASRSLIMSAATAVIVPSIERMGVAWTDIIAAVFAVIGQWILSLTIRYGDRMRASIDVGFSTLENN